MADLKGTKTEQNLWYAFAGESQARNKYTYFASVAKKEGFQQIAAIFEETANNEKEQKLAKDKVNANREKAPLNNRVRLYISLKVVCFYFLTVI